MLQPLTTTTVPGGSAYKEGEPSYGVVRIELHVYLQKILVSHTCPHTSSQAPLHLPPAPCTLHTWEVKHSIACGPSTK